MIHRQDFIPWLICSLLIVLVAYLCFKLYRAHALKKSQQKKHELTADEALAMLLQGNHEYIQSGTAGDDRISVMQNQHPVAIIVSCSDSRVSPELIFNQLHVASLFIVRNAGNLVDDIVLGSIEFGVKYLEAPLIIVLGHERCGVVTAAVDAVLENKSESAIHIKNIIDKIKPTVEVVVARTHLVHEVSIEQKAEIVKQAALENIHNMIDQISQNSPIILKMLYENKIKLIGAYYDLDHGNLEFVK